MERPTVYFSNRLEDLALYLGNKLFKESRNPFEKRTILIPSHSLKNYLSLFFANNKQFNICAGISFKSLLQGSIEEFPDGIFPSKIALSFAIEEELYFALEQKEEIFLELRKYLQGAGNLEQKIRWTCKELSDLFYQYNMYEPLLLEKWIQKKGWQQWIWKRIFSKNPVWSCLSLDLPKKTPFKHSIHLFGFAHIPSHFYEFFCKMSASFYFLSPSSYFWEDLCTDQERIFLQKKMEGKKVRLQVREQMEFFLKETHLLLANWGKVGRSLLAQFGDTESYLEEYYKDPSEEQNTLLANIQKSLLEQEFEIEKKKEVSTDDLSMVVLSAPSKLREIEALLETLLELMVKNPELEPRDILVLSYELESYFPFIQMVFSSSSIKLDFSVHGLSSRATLEKLHMLTQFFSLADSRFEKEAVLQFISFPSVMKKWEWKEEDLSLFEEWFEKANILWGFCPEYKQQSLEILWPENAFAAPISPGGTWEEGLQRLFLGLSMRGDTIDEEISSYPLPIISEVHAEKLGEFARFLFALKEDLKPIYQKEKKTFSAWVLDVKKWISFYFEKGELEEGLCKSLENLEKELGERSASCFPFASFQKAIEEYFQEKKESFQSSHLNAVKFSQVELGACYPSKIVCLLGLDESAFPRKDPPCSLREEIVPKERPSLSEKDRYFFLEALLHARVSLVLSYVATSLKDHKEQGPSFLISELLNYIDEHYFFADSKGKPSEKIKRMHPAIAFDKCYFQKDSPIRSFSPNVFQLASSYYSSRKIELPPLFPSWKKEKEFSLLEKPAEIDLKKLQDFAKDPAYFYLKERAGIFLDFNPPKEKEFFLNPLTRFQIKQEGLKKDFSLSTQRAKAKGELPSSQLGEASIDRLTQDVEEWGKSLAKFEISVSDLFTVELIQGCQQLEKEGQKIFVPPLFIEVEKSEPPVSITGKLYPVSSEGLVWAGKTDKQALLQLYPVLLVYLCIADSLKSKKECLLLESGKTFSFSIQNPSLYLSRYIKLYFRSLQEPCPVRPQWGFDFFTKTAKEIQKKQDSLSFSKGWVSPYEDWMLKRENSLEVSFVQKKWEKDWREAFSPLLLKEGENETV